MKQSYHFNLNAKPLKIVQGKASQGIDKKTKSTDSCRQATTPSQNQFEVKNQKRSISFYEHTQKRFYEDTQSSGSSSPDTHNVWESECKIDNLFDLFLTRYKNSFGSQSYNENVIFPKAIQSFKKLYGYNLTSKNIGSHPFFYSQLQENRSEKFKENLQQPKGLAKFKLTERVPFRNLTSFQNQVCNINQRYQK